MIVRLLLLTVGSSHSDLYVTAQLWADSKPLTVAVQTAYKHFKTTRNWQEWLSLPINYSSVPLSTQLVITVWDLSPAGGEGAHDHAIPFGGTTIPLFDKDDSLQKGRQRCRLHRHKAADGLSSTTTPYVVPVGRKGRLSNGRDTNAEDERSSEMARLEALMKKHEMGAIPENKWLDQLVWRQIEKLERSSTKPVRKRAKEENKRQEPKPEPNGVGNGNAEPPIENAPAEEAADEEKFYLYIEFPRFDHPIVFTDHEYQAPPISVYLAQQNSASEVQLKPPPEIQLGAGINVESEGYGDPDSGRLIRIYDPEVGIKENPAESKHRRLVRSHRTGVLDRDLKPNAKMRDELNVCDAYLFSGRVPS